jgi:hypothetical protein
MSVRLGMGLKRHATAPARARGGERGESLGMKSAKGVVYTAWHFEESLSARKQPGFGRFSPDVVRCAPLGLRHAAKDAADGPRLPVFGDHARHGRGATGWRQPSAEGCS